MHSAVSIVTQTMFLHPVGTRTSTSLRAFTSLRALDTLHVAPTDTDEAGNAADDADEPEPVEAELPELPEFVPPKPAVLAVEAEALAFAIGDPDAPVQIIEFTELRSTVDAALSREEVFLAGND